MNNSLAVKKRVLLIIILFTAFFAALIVRVAWIEIVQGKDLKQRADAQQTRDRMITPKRGRILDRNGKDLARSGDVSLVQVSPKEIKESKKEIEVAQKLSETLELTYESVYKKVTANTMYEVIKRKVEPEIGEKITKMNYKGVYLDEDSKRYYPYGNFASHVLGFIGSDNQGLNGIEIMFDKELKGTPGRIVSAKNARNTEMPYKYERFIDSQVGNDVVLTIDEVLQHFTEKHLETAVIENKVEKGGVAILMDPKTFEVLAMAVKPDFDLNEPFELNNQQIVKEIEALAGEERDKRLSEERNKMWRNKALVDTYEPGSTFKIVTAAMAMEENLLVPNESFVCNGSMKVGDRIISCHNKNGHGTQSFIQGMQNSCNPVFITLGLRVGKDNFSNYAKSFGFKEKTGLRLPGETNGLFASVEKMDTIDLATYSFGQNFTVTPLQMVCAAAAVANKGNLLRPTIVKKIVDTEGDIVEEIKPEFVRQVISEKTATEICDDLETVVSVGTGKNAYVKGYRVAGKTGTSEKQPRNKGNYIASFLGFAPADDPKLVCLVLLDEPRGEQYYGGTIAAPVVQKILEDSLKYMNVEPRYTEEELKHLDLDVPNLSNMTVAQAKEALAGAKMTAKVHGAGDTVLDQLPKPYVKLPENSTVILYTDEGDAGRQQVKVPDVTKKSASVVNQILTNAGLNIRIVGGGIIEQSDTYGNISVAQEPSAGTEVLPGTIVSVEFRHDIRD